jgi:DNA-binding NtrC family response regulator
VARAIGLLLELRGVASSVAATPEQAVAAIAAGPYDLVIQDMNFTPGATSGEEGIELFRRLRSMSPELPVLLMTAWASLETAVRLMREGAADYIEKPWDDERLVSSVRSILHLREVERETRRQHATHARARDELAARYDLCGLVYASPSMHEVVSLAVRVARADVPVLITGDNGTGKERLAELVQANSSRRDSPFVKVNIGALPDTLLEAELFGAEAGAFTGAERRRVGRFEAADGGTILLDEIGTLSPSGQTRLLRVLETGEFERLGSSHTRTVDVRVLAATNTDLRRAIAESSFREDLFFRLNVIELEMPPLRERREDIVPLAEHFMLELDMAPDGSVRRLGAAARSALESHPWPGNVRELRNRIQRASLVALGREISPEDLGLEPGSEAPPRGDEQTAEVSGERARIEAALVACDGVVARAAERLGLSRQSLYRRMDKLGITLERRLRD